jgi:hypothetical protein
MKIFHISKKFQDISWNLNVHLSSWNLIPSTNIFQVYTLNFSDPLEQCNRHSFIGPLDLIFIYLLVVSILLISKHGLFEKDLTCVSNYESR